MSVKYKTIIWTTLEKSKYLIYKNLKLDTNLSIPPFSFLED